MSSPETTVEPVTSEGPLAHAARTAAESAYLSGLDDRHRSAWERASGARPERTSKRLLVALSHTIEKAVMSGPIAEPTVVVALFQRLEHFDREREVYERMAAAGVEVVVGFVQGEAHEPPPGVHIVLLGPDEVLADEWTVVAVGPESGAFLVATDQHRFDPHERDFEASREFAGRWGYSRAQAATELARLRLALGDRVDPGPREVIDGLLGRAMPAGGEPAASAGSPGELWATTSLHHMIDTMRTAQAGTRELREQLADAHRAAAARAASSVDAASGLNDHDFLRRWATPAGGTPLTVGLALFDVAELDDGRLAADDRAAYHAAHQVAAALTQPLGPVDAAVRLSAREFAVVVPGASTRHLAGLCDAISEQLELASVGYPGVSLRATIATMVTSARPLPLDDLHEALARLAPGQGGPVDAGRTPRGERIVVASTLLHDASPGHHQPRDDQPPSRPREPQAPQAPTLHTADRRPDERRPEERWDDHRPANHRSTQQQDPDPGDSEVPLPRRTAQSALEHLTGGVHEGPSIFTDLSTGLGRGL